MKTYARTLEHRKKMSELKKKQFRVNPEISLKIAKARIGMAPPNLGKKDSQEVRKKKSESLKLAFKEGRAIPLKGKLHPRWTGFDKNCYRRVRSKRFKNGYKLEHRLIVEKHLGRRLRPKEVIHHINGNPMDNRIENLMLLKSRSDHSLLHGRLFQIKCRVPA